MGTRLSLLIGAAVAAAITVLALTAGGTAHAAADHPALFAALAVLTLGLQALSLAGFASSISVAGIGMLTVGFTLGVGPAATVAVLASAVHALKCRPKPYKACFNTATFVLAAAAGTGVFEALHGSTGAALQQSAAALAGGGSFVIVNIGLLTLAMASADARSPYLVWRERLAWVTPHYLAFGPVALLAAVLQDEVGAGGPLALAGLAVALLLALRYSRALRQHAGAPPRAA